MPSYCWTCADCGQTQDRLYAMHDDRPEVIECACGGKAERDLRSEIRTTRTETFQPFTDLHLTGKPVQITSKAQHQALMKKVGVRQMETSGDTVENPEKLGFPKKNPPLHFLPGAPTPGRVQEQAGAL